jgi:hypothetical protein
MCEGNTALKNLKTIFLAASICTAGIAAQAGGLAEAIMEPTVTETEVPFDPPQGSVNGGYLLLGAFGLMALIAAAN